MTYLVAKYPNKNTKDVIVKDAINEGLRICSVTLSTPEYLFNAWPKKITPSTLLKIKQMIERYPPARRRAYGSKNFSTSYMKCVTLIGATVKLPTTIRRKGV